MDFDRIKRALCGDPEAESMSDVSETPADSSNESSDSSTDPSESSTDPSVETRIRELSLRLDDLERELDRERSALSALQTGQEAVSEVEESDSRRARKSTVTPESPSEAAARDGIWLGSIPSGYAGDVLVMEWLAVLMARTGPAGAFRAIRHYRDIGWISNEVQQGLVDRLGGPDLDLYVDPSCPAETTAADHQDSVAFIRTLRALSLF